MEKKLLHRKCWRCNEVDLAKDLVEYWFADSNFNYEDYMMKIRKYNLLVEKYEKDLVKDEFYIGIKNLLGNSIIIFNLNDFIKWVKMVDDMKITPHDTEFRCHILNDTQMSTWMCPKDLVYPNRIEKPDMAIKTIMRLN